MVLIDLEGGAESDRQAGQNVVALHEKEGLAIDFLEEMEEAEEEEEQSGVDRRS